MIRKITRGTASANGDVTISCSITDTSKVIVILNSDNNVAFGTSLSAAGGGSVYLKSLSNSDIVVCGHGTSTGSTTINTTRYNIPVNGSVDFSYQIIEFM